MDVFKSKHRNKKENMIAFLGGSQQRRGERKRGRDEMESLRE